MGLSTAALRNGTGEFFGWWFGELAALVPTRVRSAIKSVDRTIAVTLEDAHIALTKVENGAAQSLGRFTATAGDFDGGSQEIGRILESHKAPRWRWGLWLDDTVILHDLLRLPTAALENYREAVEFQIERQTPFKRNEVYFDCRPLAPGATTGVTGIEFVIARRDAVDADVQRLTAMGIPVDFVTPSFDSERDGTPFNLLRATEAPRRRKLIALNPALVCLALLLGGILVYLPIDRDRQIAAAMSARVEQLRTEARLAARLREQIDTEERNVLSVIDQKRETPPFTRILDDLTRLIPDSAWVSRLDFRDGTIRVVMNAPESGSIIRLIEGSSQFSGARMVTAVRQLAGTGQEQFTLSFSALREAPR